MIRNKAKCKLLSVTLAIVMTFALFPAAAAAEDPTAYNIGDGSIAIDAPGAYIITGTSTANTITVAKDIDVQITLDNVNVDVSATIGKCAFRITDSSTGNVNITLVGENVLKSGYNCAGLQKSGGEEGIGKLTIGGEGSLQAVGGSNGAGIGGGLSRSSSNIVITGGANVTASGGNSGAGIGGGATGPGSNITITGDAVVVANGGASGAGIGGGSSLGGNQITISGNANVTATGGPSGAGIGGGFGGAGSHITITENAQVQATGGTGFGGGVSGGAGIGGGQNASGNNITISGGDITANGGNQAAGIGGGYNGSSDTIVISGGTVIATGGFSGAGIGGGCSGNAIRVTIGGDAHVTANGGSQAAGIGGGISGSGSNITIADVAQVTANGGASGAGIGGGPGGVGQHITITGGTVTASGADYAAGIGGGRGAGGDAITISGGEVTASSALYGAGIGGGHKEYGEGDGTNITISGGTVTATGGAGTTGDPYGGAGIGGGYQGNGANITISGGTVTAVAIASDLTSSAGIGGGFSGNGTDITISGGTVTVVGGYHSAGIGGGESGNATGITVSGGAISAAGGQGAAGIGCGYDGGTSETHVSPAADDIYVYFGDADPPGDEPSIGNPIVHPDIYEYEGAHRYFVTSATPISTDKKLVSITPPAPITGVSNGTAKTEAALGLPATVTMVTDDGDVSAVVTWDVAGSSYDPSSKKAQTFTVNGAVSLPEGVVNPDAVSLDTSVQVTVKAASGDDGSPGSAVPSEPTYWANVEGDKAGITALPVDVNIFTGSATLRLGTFGSELLSSWKTITMPDIFGIHRYTLAMSASILTGGQGEASMVFSTRLGSVTVPDNMLAGMDGTEDKTAAISISMGNPSDLPEGLSLATGGRTLVQIGLALDGETVDRHNPEAPMTVSIPYTPTAEELVNPEYIVVWFVDDSGVAAPVPNGRYDQKAGRVVLKTTSFGTYALAYNEVSFEDVSEDAWYREAVGFIAARGITSGTGAGKYSPDGRLTRSQCIVLLMNAYGIAPDQEPTDNFADAGDTWYTGHLSKAKRLGISNGVGNNMFAPDKEITRQELFTLLYNALKVIRQLPEGRSGKGLSDFADAGQIALWAKDAVTVLVETGTIGGSNGNLAPTSTTTRAEMAQVLYNLLSK